MGARPLGPKWIRKLCRITGLPVIHAVGNGGYVFEFVTTAHEHGWFNLKTQEWAIDPDIECHLWSCRTRFGQTIDLPPPPGG